jgi:hypothetical protein
VTQRELEAAVREWVEREFARDDLLAGRVPGFTVHQVQRPTGSRHLGEVRAEFDIPALWPASEAPERLRAAADAREFPGRVGAALLNDATLLQPGPTSTNDAAARFANGLTAAVAPGWALDGSAPLSLPAASRRSSADRESIVLVYRNSASYELTTFHNVHQNGPEFHIVVVASITARSADRARIARVPVPLPGE